MKKGQVGVMPQFNFKRRDYGYWSIVFICLFVFGVVFSFFLFDIVKTRLITYVSVCATSGAIIKWFWNNKKNNLPFPFIYRTDIESKSWIHWEEHFYKSSGVDVYRVYFWCAEQRGCTKWSQTTIQRNRAIRIWVNKIHE